MILLKIFAIYLLSTEVDGSHFLGGSITWQIQNQSATGTPVTIIITQTYSWTYTSATCTSAMIASNQPVPSASGLLTCFPACPAGFGTVSAVPLCTDASSLNGITTGQRLTTVSIPAGSNFSVAYQGSAWGSLATGGSAWSISSNINLMPRSDNGKYNNAPVSVMMSPMKILVNTSTVINIPVSDADGDTLRCRWATSLNGINECASVCPPSSLPSNTTIYPNCTIVITGQIVGNKYAIGLMVEDFMNSTSTTPLSSVPVQFIVKVIDLPSCLTRPEVMLLAESCTPLQVNQTFQSRLLAINHCGVNVTITDIPTLSFSGMLQSNVVMFNSSVYYKNLTWTPTTNQLGYQVMCAMALDSESSQSSQYCFTFYVTENGSNACPGVATTTSTTTIAIITTSEQVKEGGVNWPLIGSLIGLSCILALLASCCLIWYCIKHGLNCCRRKTNKYNKTYNQDVSSELSSHISNTIQNSSPKHATTSEHIIQSTVLEKVVSIKKDSGLNTPNLKSNHSSFKINQHPRRNITTTVPASKKEIILVNLHAKTSDHATLTKAKTKRRSSSFNEKLTKMHHEKPSSRIQLPRRSSAGDIDRVRITHVSRHPTATTMTLPADDIRPSIVENTIRLDDVPQHLKSELSEQKHHNPFNVGVHSCQVTQSKNDHKSSRSQQNLTTNISNRNDEHSVNVVRIKTLTSSKTKNKASSAIAPFDSTPKEQKNESHHPGQLSKSNVTIGYVVRPKQHAH